MICVKCSNSPTKVINSRPRKKTALIWRRRLCQKCGAIFTTHERPSLAHNQVVHHTNGGAIAFNLGKLIQSIAAAFSHNPDAAAYQALPLAQTVEALLSTSVSGISTDRIIEVTYGVLRRFDEVAAMQYGAKHRVITSLRRSGRPSLSSHDISTQ